MKIVCISDTHEYHRKISLPPGDVLVCAGDFTNTGEEKAALDFADWFGDQPHTHKILVPGNHDFCCDISKSRYSEKVMHALRKVSHVLIDGTVYIEGFKFYGAPWVPNLTMWAFFDGNKDRFVNAPTDIDVLVTHGPAHGVHDLEKYNSIHCGSYPLKSYINRCPKLKVHVFGHIHEAWGKTSYGDIEFLNAAICTREYAPTNGPLVTSLGENTMREPGLGTPT